MKPKHRSALLRASAILLAIVGQLPYRYAEGAGNKVWSSSPSSQVFEGTLDVVWGDPHPGFGSRGGTRYTLTLADGTRVPLKLQAKDNIAAQYFSALVIVSGQAVPNDFAATHVHTPWMILVNTILPSQLEQRRRDTASAVLGTRNVIYLLLKFADDSVVPHPPSFYTNMNNPDTPPAGEVFPTTINGFFKKTSWNQFHWLGDVGGTGGVPATDWLTLPHPKSHYAPCGWSDVCADLNALIDDGMAAGIAAGITFGAYDNVNFVLSNDLDCCAWGGGFVYAGKSYGATWEPPWGQETGTYAHEMGHSIGLPHSGWVYSAYDSPWDIMSARSSTTYVSCGSYYSDNSSFTVTVGCTEPGDGYIAPHKEYIGWIPAGNLVVTGMTTTPPVTLEGAALPLGGATKMIKICRADAPCTGFAAHYYTVEARVKGLGSISQYDNAIPGEGVIIHDFQGDRGPIGIGDPCFFNNQSGWAVPIDATPGDWNGAPDCNPGGRTWPDYALGNAEWLPGQRYVDPSNGLNIKVLSRTGSSFVVSTCVASAGATASNNGPICAGQTLLLNASTVPGATYSWTGPDGFTSTEQNPHILSALVSASGTYSVTVTVDGCSSAPATTTVVIDPLPSAAIAAPSTVCRNAPGLSASVPSAGAGGIYSWSILNGMITSGAGSNTITFAAGGSGSVQLDVTVTDGNGCSATGTKSLPIVTGPSCGGRNLIPDGRAVLSTLAPEGNSHSGAVLFGRSYCVEVEVPFDGEGTLPGGGPSPVLAVTRADGLTTVGSEVPAGCEPGVVSRVTFTPTAADVAGGPLRFHIADSSASGYPYRARLTETTMFCARWSVNSYTALIDLQNTTDCAVAGQVLILNSSGATLTALPFNLLPGVATQFAVPTGLSAIFGSAILTHDGPPGAILGGIYMAQTGGTGGANFRWPFLAIRAYGSTDGR